MRFSVLFQMFVWKEFRLPFHTVDDKQTLSFFTWNSVQYVLKFITGSSGAFIHILSRCFLFTPASSHFLLYTMRGEVFVDKT